MRAISPSVARRLAITRQGLTGPTRTGDREGVLATVRQLGCLQLDPTNVIAPSHRLVLWSRLGSYDTTALESLQWETRQLFEYWAHAASIVLTEDYPLHRPRMQEWARAATSAWIHSKSWANRFRPWVKANSSLRRHILQELRRGGPLPSSAFEDRAAEAWQSSGWTSGRNVDRMLTYLWMSGRVAVAARQAGRRWWDLADRWLPAWTPKDHLSDKAVVRQAAQRSLRALGVARPIHIEHHFIAGRYPGLSGVLDELQRTGAVLPVQVKDGSESWSGTWFVHAEDLPLLDELERGDWRPRSTLLSPFDNLIRDRARTRTMFAFDYTIEIYVPAARRKYGYYVLPILHGDRFIGRLDAVLDRKRQNLEVRAVYAEDRKADPVDGEAVASTIGDLASFVKAKTVTFTKTLPAGWRRAFNTL